MFKYSSYRFVNYGLFNLIYNYSSTIRMLLEFNCHPFYKIFNNINSKYWIIIFFSIVFNYIMVCPLAIHNFLGTYLYTNVMLNIINFVHCLYLRLCLNLIFKIYYIIILWCLSCINLLNNCLFFVYKSVAIKLMWYDNIAIIFTYILSIILN